MSGIGMQHYLVFSALLFCFGVYGLLTRRNLIAMLMSTELILNAAAVNFVVFHRFLYPDVPAGVVFPLLIIAVAAAEVSVALAVIIVLFRHNRHLDVQEADGMKG